MSRLSRFFLLILVTLSMASPARADIGVIVLEPVSALGLFTRVGHAATYLSNICPDGSPIRMRLCRPGERGSVVVRSSMLSTREDYDWAIVPFEEFLHGLASPDLAPLIGTPKLQSAIEAYDFGPVFSAAITSDASATPDGQWRAALATRFDRGIYLLSVETTPADDATIIAAFNAAPNQSRFNFFYRNCSDQVKGIFDLILPHTLGDRTSGITMQTPKGLAKALVNRALEHPELHLRIRRYAQLPGTYSRSRTVLFPMENTYRNITMAPFWFFGGFREVAFGSMVYHEVISRFDLLAASRALMSPRAIDLTLEQRQLWSRQDAIRRAQRSSSDAAEVMRLGALDVAIVQRLKAISNAKRTEVIGWEGSRTQWQALEREFQITVRSLNVRLAVRDALQRPFEHAASDGTLSRTLLAIFEAEGEFSVDRAGPWLSLRLGDEEWQSTGLSRSQILSGDPRLSVLILAAVIDYNLHQPADRREDIGSMRDLFALFRQAIDALESGDADTVAVSPQVTIR